MAVKSWDAADWVALTGIVAILSLFLLVIGSLVIQGNKLTSLPPEQQIRIQQTKLDCLNSGGHPTVNNGFFFWEPAVKSISCSHEERVNF